MPSLRPALLALAVLLFAGPAAWADEQHEAWIQRWGLTGAAGPIDFDPVQNHLLAQFHGGTVLWDVRRGLALRHYAATGHVVASRFVGENTVLLATPDRLTLHDRASGEVLKTYHVADVLSCVDVSADGRRIAAAGYKGLVTVWDTDAGQRLCSFNVERHVRTLAFAPDHRLLLAGCDDGVGFLCDTEQAVLRHRFLAPTEIRQAAFNHDGTRLVTCGSGEYWHTLRVVVWDVKTACPLQVIPRAAIDAYFVGEQLALTYPDGRRELWPADRHEEPPARKDWPTYSHTPKQRRLVAPNHWVLHVDGEQPAATLIPPILDHQKIELAGAALPPPRDHHPLAFSHDGRWLVTGDSRHDKDLQPTALWDLAAGHLARLLPAGYVAAFHPAGKLLALGTRDEVSLVEIESGKVRRTFKLGPAEGDGNEPGILTDVAISPDGETLLTATGNWYDGDGGSLVLWDLNTGEKLRSYFDHNKAVLQAAFTASGEQIVAALTPGNDGRSGIDELTVLETHSGNRLHSRMFDRYLSFVTLCPTGQHIAANMSPAVGIAFDQQVHLFPVRDFSAPLVTTGQPAAFSHDGGVLANFDPSGKLSYWNTEDGRFLHEHATPISRVRPVLFHPGQLLIAGTVLDDSPPRQRILPGVALQHMATGELAAQLLLWKPNDWLIIDKDGHISGSEGGLARITWREPGTIAVQRDRERTASRIDAANVSESLMKPLPAGRKLVDVLADQPELPDQDSAVEEDPERPWFNSPTPSKEGAIAKLRHAGAQVRIHMFRGATFVHLEKRSVTDELLEQLRWAGAVDRLYLAATGMTDDQLDTVGLLRSVKRMSLWGNPITDRGLRHLSGMWSLEVLDVHDTQVTAAGLNSLALLPNLKTLIVPSHIKRADLAPLLAKLPQLEIVMAD